MRRAVDAHFPVVIETAFSQPGSGTAGTGVVPSGESAPGKIRRQNI